MRWLFVLLLGANVALFLWGWSQEQQERRKVQTLEPELGHLPLLSETAARTPAESVQEENADGPEPPSVPEEAPVPVAVAESPVVPPPPEEAVTEGDEPPPSPVSPVVAESTSTGQEPPPAAVVPPEETPAVVAEQREPPVPVIERSCGAIGPFQDEATAREAIARLVERDIDATLRPEQEERITGYWVIIPPYPTQREAIDAVAALRQQGVVDLSRFYRGELKNGISLGVYRRERNAEMRRRQIAEKGFEAELLPRRRKQEVFYVDYQGEGAVVEGALEALRPRLGKAEVQSRACPHVATPGGIF